MKLPVSVDHLYLSLALKLETGEEGEAGPTLTRTSLLVFLL